MQSLAHVMQVYRGSSGDATKELYAQLEQLGPRGYIALNLFRAQKNSERAKVYRGRNYKDAAYGRKQWAMQNLANALSQHGPTCAITWGWGIDEGQEYHRHVLYVDLPTGQVSFHTDQRGIGPEYPKEWDGIRGASPGRICLWVAQVLTGEAAAA